VKLRGLLQRTKRAHHRVKKKQQHQQAVLVVVQLPIARLITCTANLVQFPQQRQEQLQMFQALNLPASNRFLLFRHRLPPPVWPLNLLLRSGANGVPNRRV